ncbi:MAG: DUF58 domain-containing protein [Polyangiaceae bacterium]|nr:DUF58 domain-containing protein [Polyangiaceae bacterium]MCW5789572.1 DUF58 domain-containing protein [Polyangiaceae bacterium]
MLPSRVLVLSMLGPLCLAVFTLFDPSYWRLMVAIDLAIALIALVDAALAWRPLVSVTRELHPVFSLGRANPVTLTLRSRAKRRLQVNVTDDLFEQASSEDLPLSVSIPAGGRVQASYHVRPLRRGAHALGAHHVRYGSPLGLWQRQLDLPAESPVRVYPDLEAMRMYDLMARQARELELVRATRLRGNESEFERLREYTRDDDYRSVDWKATARRQSLICREYQLESNQSLVFMLDAGRSMTSESDGIARFDHALNATLMLSHVAVRGGDRVGLVGFDASVRAFVAPASGARAARQLIQASYDLHPELVEPDYDEAFDYLSLRVRQRALVILFSHVMDEQVAATLVKRAAALSRRHLPLVVLFRDAEVERLAAAPLVGPAGLYTRGAAAEILRWQAGLVRELRRAGAQVLDVFPRELTPALINRYLEIKARRLL